MRFDRRRATLVLCLAGGLGCVDFHRGPAPRDGGARQDAGLVADPTFEDMVYPFLEALCRGCHSAEGMAANSRNVLTGNARSDRPMIVALVTPGDPAASLLLRRATGEEHPGQEVISKDSEDYKTIADWISALPTGLNGP